MNNISITNKPSKNKDSFKFFDKYISIELNYSLDYWNNYYNKELKQHFIILGRPSIEISQWSNYDNEPSFITKMLIKDYNKYDFQTFCKKINGGFSLVILDYNKNQLIIIRDKFGVYPIFYSNIEDFSQFQASTHQDILANNLDNVSLDEVSVCEFLSQGYVMHPNTYYNEIKSLDNASCLILDYNKKTILEKRYFEFKFKEEKNYNKLINELSTAIKKSIERRTIEQYGKTGVLLSGGADSRVIVCNSKTKPETFTACNEINNEFLTAQKVASTLKLKHHLIKRDDNTNIEGLIKSPIITGGMTTGGNGTWYDLLKNKQILNLDNLLTGDYADWLFKDIALNVKNIKFLNKKYPLNKFDKFNFHFYGPNVKIESLIKKIQERKEKIFSKEIRKNINELHCRRIIPLSNEYTSSSRLTLQRELGWESIFIDNDVLEVFLKIPSEYKLNGKLYSEVVGKLCNKISFIPHSNSGVKLGTNTHISSFIQFMKIAKKKFIKNKQKTLYNDNSWGNPKEMIRQDINLQKIFYGLPNQYKEFINNLLNINIFSYSLEEIIELDYHLFFNIISFYYWIKNIEKLKEKF